MSPRVTRFAVLLLLGAWRVAVWWRRARAAVFAAAHRGDSVPVRIRRRRWDASVVGMTAIAAPATGSDLPERVR